MQWIQHRSGDRPRVGLLDGERILVPDERLTMMELLERGSDQMAALAARTRKQPAAELAYERRLLAPVIEPRSIRDVLCFLQHLRNCRGGAELDPLWHEIPAFYFSNPAAVVGPYDPVPISPGSQQFDFELEVAAIIGRGGANLHPDHAEEHIAGYTILCDWSARDLQLREMSLSLGPAKGKDGATTLGPMLVTSDELATHRGRVSFDLGMRAYVNGELVGGGSLDQMDWSFGEVVAYASRGTVLEPGDVIGSGTVPTGCLLEHFATKSPAFRGWLEPGDVVRLEVDRLGFIEHEIVAGVAPQPVRRSQRR